MDADELKENIEKLEEEKKKYISEIKRFNGRKRYKMYEQKALGPFVEKTRGVRIGPFRKNMRSLEYKIATQAYTPKSERDIIKQLKKLEADYAKVREVERARRKLKLVTSDIVEIDGEIERIEVKLREIRSELSKLYGKRKMINNVRGSGATFGRVDEEFSLADLADIEEKGKKTVKKNKKN